MGRLFRVGILVTVVFLDCSVESKVSADGQNVDRRDSIIQNEGTPVVSVPVEKMPEGIVSTCTAWTDGCRACGRNPDGIFCSNEGIACQSSKMQCVRHE